MMSILRIAVVFRVGFTESAVSAFVRSLEIAVTEGALKTFTFGHEKGISPATKATSKRLGIQFILNLFLQFRNSLLNQSIAVPERFPAVFKPYGEMYHA